MVKMCGCRVNCAFAIHVQQWKHCINWTSTTAFLFGLEHYIIPYHEYYSDALPQSLYLSSVANVFVYVLWIGCIVTWTNQHSVFSTSAISMWMSFEKAYNSFYWQIFRRCELNRPKREKKLVQTQSIYRKDVNWLNRQQLISFYCAK